METGEPVGNHICSSDSIIADHLRPSISQMGIQNHATPANYSGPCFLVYLIIGFVFVVVSSFLYIFDSGYMC